MKKFIFVHIAFLILVAIPLATAQAECTLSVKTPFSAVPLYKMAFLGRLENENLLKELCPTEDRACVTDALSSQTDKIPVYDRPSGNLIANLDVTYTPGKGIEAALIQGKKVFSFVPPLYDTDWGYGPWFHATLLDQSGAWKNIALPLIKSGWVELPESDVITLNDRTSVYTLNNRGIVILGSSDKNLTVRDEQPADMWCADGDPPPLSAFREDIIPLSEAYDNQCNLRLLPAYKRGC